MNHIIKFIELEIIDDFNKSFIKDVKRHAYRDSYIYGKTYWSIKIKSIYLSLESTIG